MGLYKGMPLVVTIRQHQDGSKDGQKKSKAFQKYGKASLILAPDPNGKYSNDGELNANDCWKAAQKAQEETGLQLNEDFFWTDAIKAAPKGTPMVFHYFQKHAQLKPDMPEFARTPTIRKVW